MLRWVTDTSRGDWVAPRLDGWGVVGSVVPRGFPAYARVLHRATDREAGPVRWAEVAASAGTRLHPTAQWWCLARRPDWYAQQPNVAHDEPWPQDWPWPEGHDGTRRGAPGEWPGGNPQQGELDHEQLAALVGVLRRFTDPDAVTAAFWEGSAWQGGVYLTFWRDDETGESGSTSGPTGPYLEPSVIDGPKLELPGRAHIVFAGALDDVAALAAGTATADVAPFTPGSRTPSLLWPDDRSWCVATEVDFDSTLVGGSRALVDAVLADETIEAFEVSPADSLASDADEVNR